MQIGKLDRRVTIESVTLAADGYGGQVETWALLATVWAQVVPLTGRELFQAQQVNAEAEARFRIRWRSDVTPKMRIKHDGDTYEVLYVAEIGRREGLDIMTKAVRLPQ